MSDSEALKEKEARELRLKLTQEAVNASPYYRHVRMRVVGYTEQGSLMEMELGPELRNVWGTVHGGAIASLVDSSCGTSIAVQLGAEETIVTVDLKLQFFAAAKEGKLQARGKVIHKSRRFAYAESEVFDESGRMIAKGSTIHAVLRRGSSGPGEKAS